MVRREQGLEYIQCQHCQNKYAVSEKLRALTGRKIRCKHCQKVFEIAIHTDVPADNSVAITEIEEPGAAAPELITPAVDEPREESGAAETDEVDATEEHQPESQETDAQETDQTAEAPKKRRSQLWITATLALLLIAAASATGLFFYYPEWFRSAEQPATEPVIPAKLVDPMPAQPEQGASTQKDADPSSKAQKRDQPTQACKDAAAEYWLRTRVLATTKLASKAYMQLLEMNLEQAEQMRELCGDKDVVSRVSAAARAGTQPQWLRDAISARSFREDAP